MIGRGGRGAIALAVAVVVLGACTEGVDPAAPAPSPSPSEEGTATLRWALPEDPTSLDPARIVRSGEEVVIDALFDSLTHLDEAGVARPAVATSWESDETATRFLFTLDPDARWSTGEPVVAADVVRGLTRIADGGRPRPSLHAELLRDVQGFAAAQRGEALTGVRATDDRTVEILLARPSPQLPVLLAHPALAPVPALADDDPATFAMDPVGNGPFVLAEDWAHNQFLRLVPSPTHASTPALDELVFRVYADDVDGEVRWADLVAGQVQVADVPTGRRDDVEGVARLVGDTTLTSVLLAATDHPLLQDVQFRRAVSVSVDRDSVAGRTGGARRPASSLVPPGLLGSQEQSCRWCRHDPELAAGQIDAVVASLSEQGLEDLPPLRMVTTDDDVSRAVADELRTALRAADLLLRVDSVSPAALPAAIEADAPDLVLLTWSATAPTAESFLVGLLGPDSVGRAATRWEPPALQDLLQRIRDGVDVADRVRAVRELERLVVDEAVAIPVHVGTTSLAVSVEVSTFDPAPDGTVDLTEVGVGGGAGGSGSDAGS